jgi:hypothetical protein
MNSANQACRIDPVGLGLNVAELVQRYEIDHGLGRPLEGQTL